MHVDNTHCHDIPKMSTVYIQPTNQMRTDVGGEYQVYGTWQHASKPQMQTFGPFLPHGAFSMYAQMGRNVQNLVYKFNLQN